MTWTQEHTNYVNFFQTIKAFHSQVLHCTWSDLWLPQSVWRWQAFHCIQCNENTKTDILHNLDCSCSANVFIQKAIFNGLGHSFIASFVGFDHTLFMIHSLILALKLPLLVSTAVTVLARHPQLWFGSCLGIDICVWVFQLTLALPSKSLQERNEKLPAHGQSKLFDVFSYKTFWTHDHKASTHFKWCKSKNWYPNARWNCVLDLGSWPRNNLCLFEKNKYQNKWYGLVKLSSLCHLLLRS